MTVMFLAGFVLIEYTSPYTTWVPITDTLTGKKGWAREEVSCLVSREFENTWCAETCADWWHWCRYYETQLALYYIRWRHYVHCTL